jgi:hypothetical protein
MLFLGWIFGRYQTIAAPIAIEAIAVLNGGAEAIRIPFDPLDALNEKG